MRLGLLLLLTGLVALFFGIGFWFLLMLAGGAAVLLGMYASVKRR